MLSDFDIIQHRFDDTIIVYPVSDIHYGALEHNEKEWNAFCQKILSEKNAYLILNGDLINNATRSSVSNVFEDRYRPSEQKKRMAEMLEPVKDRILCATSGNHESRSGKDADSFPMYDIMCKLGIEDLYRENAAFVKIKIGSRTVDKRKKNGIPDSNQTYIILATHGTGGGIYTGASVNRNERFIGIFDNVDALVVGHTHKGAITRPKRYVVDARNNVILERELLIVSSVSWLEYGGYALRKMLVPASTCRPQAMILENANKNSKKYIKTLW